MVTSLPSLPVEIIDLIADDLETTDFHSLRLVCQELKAKTLHRFLRKARRHAFTDLSHASLSKLEQLCESETIRQHIRELKIKHTDGKETFGEDLLWTPKPHVVGPPEGMPMLANLLVNKMVNCRSFSLNHSACLPSNAEEQHTLGGMDCLQVLLSTLAEQNLGPKLICLHQHCSNPHLNQFAYTILNTLPQSIPNYSGIWSQLEELHVGDTFTRQSCTNWLLEIFKNSPKLRKLILVFLVQDTDNLLEHLSTDIWSLPALRHLEILKACVAGPTLLGFISRFGETLKTLKLVRPILHAGMRWKELVLALSSHLPHLQHIKLRKLIFPLSNEDGHPTRWVRFPILRDVRIRRDPNVPILGDIPLKLYGEWLRNKSSPYGIQYEGEKMSEALRLIADTLYYKGTRDDPEPYPNPPIPREIKAEIMGWLVGGP
ncbi:hypothetical protein G7Y89_g10090 [Cudoniella acicularis]|uniref:F-box domain-containing protein n=1 Tax=Cudoniella acicularis TaxID=354080 RepID=A0A8H4RG62_9HELO|nr:hypothetical protein G7Y89_g10090 [Cudoniella acicularis]